MDRVDIKVGMGVRIFSPAGPCLRGRVVRINRETIGVERLTGYDREYHFSLHTDPCDRCTDHPRTTYPRGYES